MLAALEYVGVPAARVNDLREAVEDEQTRARGLVAHIGDQQTIRFPAVLSDTPATLRRAAPLLGADTAGVLAELGQHQTVPLVR